MVIEQINNLLRAVRELTELGICYYDLTDFFGYNRLGQHGNSIHYCEFCKSAHLLPNGRAECDRSDRNHAVSNARAYQRPFFHKCHMGLCELVIPLFHQDTLIGLIFVGQARVVDMTDEKNIRMCAENHGGNGDFFVECYKKLPETDAETLLNAGTIIAGFFENLIRAEGESAVRLLTVKEAHPDICDRIMTLIQTRYRMPLTSGRICKEFFLNPSYIARLFKNRFGVTVTDCIHQTRIEHAKQLLAGTRLDVGSIAMNVGYTDMNYFSRMFRRYVGESPSEYRKKRLEKDFPGEVPEF